MWSQAHGPIVLLIFLVELQEQNSLLVPAEYLLAVLPADFWAVP
jgi:hypothetical protein